MITPETDAASAHQLGNPGFTDSFKTEDRPRAAAPEGTEAVFHGTNLATATADEMQAVLTNTVLDEFKTRLAGVGSEYQEPKMPV